MKTDYLTLIGWLWEEFEEVRRSAQRALELCRKALRTGDDGYWDGVALNLHGFYTGVERIFETIAREVDHRLPGGPDRHRDLLTQMSAEIPEVRPPVISRETRNCLDEYRGFRHVVRHVYTFNLRTERTRALAEDVEDCLERVQRDLERFTAFLRALESHEGSLDGIDGNL